MRFLGVSTLQKEIQSALAHCAYDQLMQSDSMGLAAQPHYLSKLFHGDPDEENRSYCWLSVNGLNRRRLR